MPFTYQTTIKFHETDAAARLFFAQQFKICHDAYEAWLEAAGLRLADIVTREDFAFPIVHAEADFLAPLFVGDRLSVTVDIAKIGQSSFTLEYALQKGPQAVGTARTVHVTVDKMSGQKIRLPDKLRQILANI